MTLKVFTSLMFAAALTCTALQAKAASDPEDPDCPIVNELRSIAREVDVYNTLCGMRMGPCDEMRENLAYKASRYPGLMIQRMDGQLIYDPETVQSIFNGYPMEVLFDCDPEDEDCNGKTVSAQRAQERLRGGEVGPGTITLFPLSNFTGPLPY